MHGFEINGHRARKRNCIKRIERDDADGGKSTTATDGKSSTKRVKVPNLNVYSLALNAAQIYKDQLVAPKSLLFDEKQF